MTDSSYERDVMANEPDQAASEEQLITRLARDRRDGLDTTQGVKDLLGLSQERTAALHQLAE